MGRRTPVSPVTSHDGFSVGDIVELVREVRLYGREVRLYGRGGKSHWYERGARAKIIELCDSGPVFGQEFRLRFARYREPLARPVMDGLAIFQHVSIIDRIARLA